MFLPVTMDSAERIVETIQEIKEKIPSDPFEAEIILMAEMVAEQEKNDKQERLKETEGDKDNERPEALPTDGTRSLFCRSLTKIKIKRSSSPVIFADHASNYSDDLDTDDLANFLNNWEETSCDAAAKSPSRPSPQEKLNPTVDVSLGMPSEPYCEPPPPPPAPPRAPPAMDIETDFTVGEMRSFNLIALQSFITLFSCCNVWL